MSLVTHSKTADHSLLYERFSFRFETARCAVPQQPPAIDFEHNAWSADHVASLGARHGWWKDRRQPTITSRVSELNENRVAVYCRPEHSRRPGTAQLLWTGSCLAYFHCFELIVFSINVYFGVLSLKCYFAILLCLLNSRLLSKLN